MATVNINGLPVMSAPSRASVLEIQETVTAINKQISAEHVAKAIYSVAVPATASDTGSPGDLAYDSTHIYVCIAINTWVRATLATW